MKKSLGDQKKNFSKNEYSTIIIYYFFILVQNKSNTELTAVNGMFGV